MYPSQFLEKLEKIVGPAGIKTELSELSFFDTDWTKLPGNAQGACLPKSTKEVSEILALCSEAKVAVVPSGGRTGLAGGAVVAPGQLALGLSRMNQVLKIDAVGRSIRVEAGATTQAVHEAVHPHGLTWPIDLAAKGSSTIGGNLSTNAGGTRVIRYGMTRKWVTALEAVLMSGKVIELNGALEKNNTGYDLMQLLIGSEGTLAVITRATLKLTSVSKAPLVVFFAVSELEAFNHLLQFAWKGPFNINAYEFLSKECLQLVQRQLGRGREIEPTSPFYGMLEVEPLGDFSAWLEEAMEKSLIVNGHFADSPEKRRELWSIREGITESIAKTGPVVKFDVAVPVARTAEFLGRIKEQWASKEREFDLYLFGHFGDGSPHLNLVKKAEAATRDFEKSVREFEPELFELLKSFGGSASSEHGVGTQKKHWVTFSRSPEEMAIFRGVKAVFDPQWLLNPGKIFDRA